MQRIFSKRGTEVNLGIALVALALLALGLAVMLVFIPSLLAKFFMFRWQINAIIVASFVFGIVYFFTSMFRLQREFDTLHAVQDRFELGEDRKWMEGEALAMLPHSFVRERIALYAEQVRYACPPDAESHIDRVARTLGLRTGVTRYIGSLLIFLGLLGTFIGLLLSLTSIQGIIAALPTGSEESAGSLFVKALKDNLEGPIGGMATAYSCSVFGLVGSLIIGFLHLQLASAQNRYITRLESLDSAFIRPIFRARFRTEATSVASSAHLETSQRIMKENLERLGAVVERTEGMQANFRDVMVTLGKEIEITNTAISRLSANQDLIRESAGRQVDMMRAGNESQSLILTELQHLHESIGRLNAIQKAGQEADRDLQQELIRVLRNEVGALARLATNHIAAEE
jgi:biopolymer transport protein ExbB/TolQ